MHLISKASLACAATLLVAGTAFAQSSQPLQRVSAEAPRASVYVCDTSEDTRRAFESEYGRMEFVDARDVVAGRVPADGTPRCITEEQLRRVEQIRRQSRMLASR